MGKKKRVRNINSEGQRTKEIIQDNLRQNYNTGKKFFSHFERSSSNSLTADIGGNFSPILVLKISIKFLFSQCNFRISRLLIM